MTRKLAVVLLIHECDEDPCHLKNDVQEAWIRERIESDKRLKFNWRLQSVRVIDLKGGEQENLV